MALFGYIPVCKLECFTKKQHSEEAHHLFHKCMQQILKPLIAAGKEGIDMVCANGFIQKVFPILSVYIANYLEQCLVICCKENSCPMCLVKPEKQGEYRVHSVLVILSLLWRLFQTKKMDYLMNLIIRAFITLIHFGKTYCIAISSPV